MQEVDASHTSRVNGWCIRTDSIPVEFSGGGCIGEGLEKLIRWLTFGSVAQQSPSQTVFARSHYTRPTHISRIYNRPLLFVHVTESTGLPHDQRAGMGMHDFVILRHRWHCAGCSCCYLQHDVLRRSYRANQRGESGYCCVFKSNTHELERSTLNVSSRNRSRVIIVPQLWCVHPICAVGVYIHQRDTLRYVACVFIFLCQIKKYPYDGWYYPSCTIWGEKQRRFLGTSAASQYPWSPPPSAPAW